jgi:group I intron endonuclease
VNSGIYLIQNVKTRLCYIGQSRNLTARLQYHKSALRNQGAAKPRTNVRLAKSFAIHGESNFQFVVLELCEPHALTSRENYWLEEFRDHHGFPIANFEGPADCPWLGGKHSQEARKLISEKHKGRPRTERQLEAMRRDGKKASPETRMKMSMARAGKTRDFSRSILEAYARRINTPEIRARSRAAIVRPVFDQDTGERWESMTDCARDLGVVVSAIANHLSGKNKTCKGRRLQCGRARS